MTTAIFHSGYLKDNFYEIKELISKNAFNNGMRYQEIEPALLAGIVAGDSGKEKGIDPTCFDSIITMMGYTDSDMTSYIACEFGLAIGYFESVDFAVQYLFSSKEDFARVAQHLTTYSLETVDADQLRQNQADIKLAMALIDSYFVDAIW